MADGMTSCPSCGTGNSEGKKFCSACGSKLEPPAPLPPPSTPEESGSEAKAANDGNRVSWPLAVAAMVVLALSIIGVGYVTAVILGEEPLGGNELQSSEASGSESGAGGAETKLLCADEITPVQASLEVEPTECTILGEDASDNPASSEFIVLSELEWNVWNEDRAIADGVFIKMGRNAAQFELYDPQESCGETVFTRYRWVQPGYTPSLPIPIASCLDR